MQLQTKENLAADAKEVGVKNPAEETCCCQSFTSNPIITRFQKKYMGCSPHMRNRAAPPAAIKKRRAVAGSPCETHSILITDEDSVPGHAEGLGRGARGGPDVAVTRRVRQFARRQRLQVRHRPFPCRDLPSQPGVTGGRGLFRPRPGI